MNAIPEISTTVATLLLGLGIAVLPAYGADKEASMPNFKTLDTNKDGQLSLDEFTAKGKDDLLFKAADLDGDGRVDRGEYARYAKIKARDQAKSESSGAAGAAGSPRPAPSPTEH